MRKLLRPLLLVTPLIAVALSAPATAATGGLGSGTSQGNSCESSDPAYVVVDSTNDTAAVTGNVAKAGNYFGCYTNVHVKAGDTITFTHDSTVCGGGAPRVYVAYKDGFSENTHDGNLDNCVAAAPGTTGTVTYTLTHTGKIRTFAFISDRDNSTITYSKLVIAGNVVNF